MKYLRLLALLMAAMLCLAACSAKDENTEAEPTAVPEVTAAAEADSATDVIADGSESWQSLMVESLAMPYESWMTENMYSAFAATFFMDIAYVDALNITQLSTESSVPAVYVGELQGENYGNGMNLTLFFTNSETTEVTMLNATVYLATGLFEGYTKENVGDIKAEMDALVSDGFLQVYHEISTEEFMSAYSGINQVLSGVSATE